MVLVCSLKLGRDLLLFLALMITAVDCKRSINVAFPGSDCGSGVKEIDGAQLYSSHGLRYAHNPCTLQFKSDDDHGTRKRKDLMLNFKQFNITDCSVSLKIYYSSDAYGTSHAVLDCKTRTIPPLYNGSHYVTLQLDRKKIANDGYDFLIIITAYRPVHPVYNCYDLMRCNTGVCIERKLMCDGVDHCSDNSDENHCPFDDYDDRHPLTLAGWVVIAFMFVVVGSGVGGLRYRRYRALITQRQVIDVHQPLYVQQPTQIVTTYQGGPCYPQQPAPQYYPGPTAGVPGQPPYQQQPAPQYYQGPPLDASGQPPYQQQSGPQYYPGPTAGVPGQPPYQQQPAPQYYQGPPLDASDQPPYQQQPMPESTMNQSQSAEPGAQTYQTPPPTYPGHAPYQQQPLLA